MLANEFYEQFFKYPVLRIAVFLVLLSILIELFVVYVCPWIKSDVNEENLTTCATRDACASSLFFKAKQEELLDFQRKKIADMLAKLEIWEAICKDRQLQRLKDQEEQMLFMVNKQEIALKNTQSSKLNKILAKACAGSLQQQKDLIISHDNELLFTAMQQLRDLK